MSVRCLTQTAHGVRVLVVVHGAVCCVDASPAHERPHEAELSDSCENNMATEPLVVMDGNEISLDGNQIADFYAILSASAKYQNVSRQLFHLGAVSVTRKGRHVFFRSTVRLIPSFVACQGVSRICLCLIDRKFSDLCATNAIEECLRSANIALAVNSWSQLHGFRPLRWIFTIAFQGCDRRLQGGHQIEHILRRGRSCLEALQHDIDPLPASIIDEGPEQSAAFVVELALLDNARACCAVPMLRRRVASTQSCLVHQGLHHSVSYGLARLARLRPGEMVLDPCCGTASLPIEAREFWPLCGGFLCADFDAAQLSLAAENCEAHHRFRPGAGGQLAVLRADCSSLPLRPAALTPSFQTCLLACIGSPRATELCTRSCFSKLVAFFACAGRAVLLTRRYQPQPCLSRHMKAAKLEMHAAVPADIVTFVAWLCCSSRKERPSEGAVRQSGAPCFDMGGCDYTENGDIPTWLSWRHDKRLIGRVSR